MSRCQVFDFKRISIADIAEYLKYVADKEQVEADEEALHLIAEKADGAMRDALSIFDQLVSFTSGKVTYQNVVENLHVLDYDYFFQISDQFLNGNITSVLLILNDIIDRGFDGQHFIIGLGEHLRNLLISSDVQTIGLMETSAAVKQRYLDNAKRFSPAFLLKALDLNTQCDINYKTSNNKRLLLELTLMQMVALGSGIQQPALDTQIANAVPKPQAKPIASPAPQKEISVQETVIPKPEEKKEVSAMPIQQEVPKAEEAVGTEKMSADQPTKPVEEQHRQTRKIKPGSKVMGLGVSLKTEEAMSEEEVNPDAYMLGKENIADSFTQEDVDKVFTRFLETIKSQQGLYATLKTNGIKVNESNELELRVYNDAQRIALSDKLFEMVKLMRIELNNYKLKASVRIIDNPNVSPSMSPSDKYSAMVEKNPNLQKLRDNLTLELDL